MVRVHDQAHSRRFLCLGKELTAAALSVETKADDEDEIRQTHLQTCGQTQFFLAATVLSLALLSQPGP